MDRDFTQLSDEQWAYINEKISAVGQAHRDEGEGPVNDISLIFMWSPIGRIVELRVGGAPTIIEDPLT